MPTGVYERTRKWRWRDLRCECIQCIKRRRANARWYQRRKQGLTKKSSPCSCGTCTKCRNRQAVKRYKMKQRVSSALLNVVKRHMI